MTLKTVAASVVRIACVVGGLLLAFGAQGETPDKPKYPAGYVEEAPLPAGFPPPSAPGTVVEKIYPVIRSYSATGSGAFMKCFAYLSLKHHNMTAPVVMEYKPSPDDRPPLPAIDAPVPVRRMHFLLEKNSLDKPQEAGPVKVDDMPALRVLSLAFQGETTPEAVKKGQAQIEARLKQLTDVRRAGDYRILGYNSPMLDRKKNFWELQLPIENSVTAK